MPLDSVYLAPARAGRSGITQPRGHDARDHAVPAGSRCEHAGQLPARRQGRLDIRCERCAGLCGVQGPGGGGRQGHAHRTRRSGASGRSQPRSASGGVAELEAARLMTKMACAVRSGRPRTGLGGLDILVTAAGRDGRRRSLTSPWPSGRRSWTPTSRSAGCSAGRPGGSFSSKGGGERWCEVGLQRDTLGMASYSGYSRAMAASTSSPALWHGSGASTASTSTAWHRGCSDLRLPSGCGVTTPRTSACSAGSPSGGSASQGISSVRSSSSPLAHLTG